MLGGPCSEVSEGAMGAFESPWKALGKRSSHGKVSGRLLCVLGDDAMGGGKSMGGADPPWAAGSAWAAAIPWATAVFVPKRRRRSYGRKPSENVGRVGRSSVGCESLPRSPSAVESRQCGYVGGVHGIATTKPARTCVLRKARPSIRSRWAHAAGALAPPWWWWRGRTGHTALGRTTPGATLQECAKSDRARASTCAH